MTHVDPQGERKIQVPLTWWRQQGSPGHDCSPSRR